MTADHGDNAVPGRYPHRPDGDGRFEVVVRGYDRRQVDEYVANLELTIARQRTELEQAREALSRPGANGAFRGADEQARGFSGAAPARTAEGSGGHMIEAFTGRLQTILQEAHEEAEEIRSNAHSFARKEEEAARARIADLERRRDAVVGDLSRVRNGLDALVGQLLGTEQAGQKKPGDDKAAPRAEGAPSPTPRPSPSPSASSGADKPSATPRSDSAPSSTPPSPSPRPHPEPKPRPHPEPAPRSESAPRPHPEPGPRKTEPAGPPSPTPRSDSAPRLGQQLPLNEGLRPSPSPRSEDAARAPRPSPTPAGAPASSPQVTPSAQSKPRPSPSPRPRTTPPSPGSAAPGTGQRNGVSNQNGATATRDEEGGGHSAFGTGAR